MSAGTKRLVAIVAGLAIAGGTAFAQRRPGGFGPPQASLILPNTPYDGKFTFVRLRYGPPVSYASQRVYWSHDYPTGEQHFMKILNELSYLNAHRDETSILPLDSPDLCKYPVAYMAEPGFLTLTDAECRQYLQGPCP